MSRRTLMKYIIPFLPCDLCETHVRDDQNCLCRHGKILCRNKHGNSKRKMEMNGYTVPGSYTTAPMTEKKSVFTLRRRTKCSICQASETTDPTICMVLFNLFFRTRSTLPINSSLVLTKRLTHIETGLYHNTFEYSMIFPMCCKHRKGDVLKQLYYAHISGLSIEKYGEFFPSSEDRYNIHYRKKIFHVFRREKGAIKCTYCEKYIRERQNSSVVNMSAKGMLRAQIFCSSCYSVYKSNPHHERYRKIMDTIQGMDSTIEEYAEFIEHIKGAIRSFGGKCGNLVRKEYSHSPRFGFHRFVPNITHTMFYIVKHPSEWEGSLYDRNTQLFECYKQLNLNLHSYLYTDRSAITKAFLLYVRKDCERKGIEMSEKEHFLLKYLKAINSYIVRHRFTEDGVYKV